MPKNRRQHKRTKYSSDSSDDYHYERRHRERSKKSPEKSRSRRKSSSSRSSDSRSSSSSSSSSNDSHSHHSKSRSRSSSIRHKKSSSSHKEPEEVKKFELDDLYKEKDKVKVLEEIESSTFKQSTFKQSSSSKIIVDLEKDKILIPPATSVLPEDENLIHPSFLGDSEKRVDKWIKKLYIYRNQ